jgi:hypothetical protein
MTRHPSTAVPGLPVTGESHDELVKSPELATVGSEQPMADEHAISRSTILKQRSCFGRRLR